MSRENRRRQPASEPAAPAPMAMRTDSDEARTGGAISWRHCFLGLLIGEALLLILADGGGLLADAAFGPSSSVDGGILGMATLLSVMAGAYIAARGAGRLGMYQGIAVAGGFIAVAALIQFGSEAGQVHQSLASGTNRLIDLGPMNMGDLMSNDLLALFAGSVGGLLSGKR